MTWIVTGGAGYIGAHVVQALSRLGEVVVFDDLSTGRLDRLPPDVPVVKGSVTSPHDLDMLLAGSAATGVVHLAAQKAARPGTRSYWPDNVDGVGHLVEAMNRAGVDRLLFASSAAVYGDTGRHPARERQKLAPVNPYGVSKLEAERIIVARSGLRSLALRQFNVVGAGSHPYAADTCSTSLLSAVFRALTGGPELVVRGDDHPTRDGSAVRDYVHIDDVVQAYLRGVDLLSDPSRPHRVVNVGSGLGTSVLDVVRTAGRVTGAEVPFRVGQRRGDEAAEVVADLGRARRTGLEARRSLDEAVASAWESWRKYVS